MIKLKCDCSECFTCVSRANMRKHRAKKYAARLAPVKMGRPRNTPVNPDKLDEYRELFASHELISPRFKLHDIAYECGVPLRDVCVMASSAGLAVRITDKLHRAYAFHTQESRNTLACMGHLKECMSPDEYEAFRLKLWWKSYDEIHNKFNSLENTV